MFSSKLLRFIKYERRMYVDVMAEDPDKSSFTKETQDKIMLLIWDIMEGM